MQAMEAEQVVEERVVDEDTEVIFILYQLIFILYQLSQLTFRLQNLYDNHNLFSH